MAKLIRSPKSKRDAAEIWEFVARDNQGAADQLMADFDEALEHLLAFPGMGRSRDELQPGLRSFGVGKCLLFYRQVKGGIRLVRIIHGMRDLPAQFRSP